MMGIADVDWSVPYRMTIAYEIFCYFVWYDGYNIVIFVNYETDLFIAVGEEPIKNIYNLLLTK